MTDFGRVLTAMVTPFTPEGEVDYPRARELAEANGWKRLATNSAKLTNIIGGYGYRPALLSMEACVAAACAGGRIGQ